MKPHIDSPVPNPNDFDSEEAYGAALDAYGEAMGWTDDPLELMDILARKRIASYRNDVDPYADLKARNAEAQRAVDDYLARTGREVGPTERKILLQQALSGRLPEVR